jgi:hypothetical protein
MRVEATEVGPTIQNRNPVDPDEEVTENIRYDRAATIQDIQNAALEFAADFMCSFDLPASPQFRLNRTVGLESAHRAYFEVSAVIHIECNIRNPSGHITRFELAIPLSKGEFQKPTIAIYKNRRCVISQDFFNRIFEAVATTRPHTEQPLSPNRETVRMPNSERDIFQAPIDPTEWSLLVSERY